MYVCVPYKYKQGLRKRSEIHFGSIYLIQLDLTQEKPFLISKRS